MDPTAEPVFAGAHADPEIARRVNPVADAFMVYPADGVTTAWPEPVEPKGGRLLGSKNKHLRKAGIPIPTR
jgi:hypothetical protein